MTDKPAPECRGCRKHPAEIQEYIDAGLDFGLTAEEFVRQQEGTYNEETGGFLCTDCYLKAGSPSLPWPHSWRAE